MAALVDNQSVDQDSQRKEFTPLLKALTASSSMCLSVEGVDNEKIMNVMITLTAMVESVPVIFMGTKETDPGNKAVHFALNEILLERGEEKDEDDNPMNETEDADDKQTTPSKRKPRRSITSKTLSLACQRKIAAIDFLVSHIRSTILHARKSSKQQSSKSIGQIPSDEHISAVFEVLVNLIRDGGYMASSQSHLGKNVFKERSALRKAAAISLLKLCDGSLNIENKFLSSKYWHIFSRAFVDEDFEVRGKVVRMIEEE